MTHHAGPEAQDVLPAPPHLPDPTPWPLIMALGITFIGGGLVLEPFLLLGVSTSAVGLVLFALALLNLIREDIVTAGSHDS